MCAPMYNQGVFSTLKLSMVFPESLKDVSLKGVSRMFQRCFKEVIGMFAESFKGVSR